MNTHITFLKSLFTALRPKDTSSKVLLGSLLMAGLIILGLMIYCIHYGQQLPRCSYCGNMIVDTIQLHTPDQKDLKGTLKTAPVVVQKVTFNDDSLIAYATRRGLKKQDNAKGIMIQWKTKEGQLISLLIEKSTKKKKTLIKKKNQKKRKKSGNILYLSP